MKNQVLIVILTAVCVFSLISTPQSQNLATARSFGQPPPLYHTPIWPITEEGTAVPVTWVDAANPRFAVFDGNTAADPTDDLVFDRETGLVWQRSPMNTTAKWYDACKDAYNHSYVYMTRKGWRLPSVEELTSLVRPYVSPSLPTGHPFINVEPEAYWTATTRYTYYDYTVTASRTNYAYVVHFNNGAVGYQDKDLTNRLWLVRGGRGSDGM